jgi:hypothetical protein
MFIPSQGICGRTGTWIKGGNMFKHRLVCYIENNKIVLLSERIVLKRNQNKNLSDKNTKKGNQNKNGGKNE